MRNELRTEFEWNLLHFHEEGNLFHVSTVIFWDSLQPKGNPLLSAVVLLAEIILHLVPLQALFYIAQVLHSPYTDQLCSSPYLTLMEWCSAVSVRWRYDMETVMDLLQVFKCDHYIISAEAKLLVSTHTIHFWDNFQKLKGKLEWQKGKFWGSSSPVGEIQRRWRIYSTETVEFVTLLLF